MPSPSKRICVFGDSHFACVKYAFDAGLVDTRGFEVEFWGNIGRRFRYLTWRNDQIETVDQFSAKRFAKTNVHGRQVLNARDFDAILFMGCRIGLFRLFPELLHRRRRPENFVSSGVERRLVRDTLRSSPPYEFAVNMAAQQAAKILIFPTPLNTDGFEETIPETFAAAREADAEDRRAVWDRIGAEMQADGITLIPQPDHTVVNGCCTDTRYAVRDYVAREDPTHKNPEFGALIFEEALTVLRGAEQSRPDAPSQRVEPVEDNV